MAPKRNIEVLELDELRPLKVSNNHTQIGHGIDTIEKQRQLRITVYHWVVHIIAFLILTPYVSLILTKNVIPESYSTIVSVVIGFYFAKSLFRY